MARAIHRVACGVVVLLLIIGCRRSTTGDVRPTSAASTTGPTLMPVVSVTNDTALTLTGKALKAGSLIRVEGATATVETTSAANRSFSVDLVLKQNTQNTLVITEFFDGDTSQPSPPVTVKVHHDGQPPTLFIDFPADGEELTVPATNVSGRVGDMLSGFEGLTVTVNGAPANVNIGIGTNGTFDIADVALQQPAAFLGGGTPTVLSVVATDAVGNAVTKEITVSYVEPEGNVLLPVSGNNQVGLVDEPLAAPLVVEVRRPDSSPFAGKLVQFQVVKSNGRLTTDGVGAGSLKLSVQTDASGLARAFLRLGSDAGMGNNRVKVTSQDVVGTAYFCASAGSAGPSQINVGTGDMQIVQVGGQAGEALKVWVSDGCNGVAGIPVVFRVEQGGGKLVKGNKASTKSLTVVTSATGHAQLQYIVGAEPGNNVVSADFPQNTTGSADFTLLAVAADAEDTTFEGQVLDNSSQPIAGVTVTLDIPNPDDPAVFVTSTDAAGRFLFTGLPAGKASLEVEGGSATSVGGMPIDTNELRFPDLHYEPVVLAGAANELSMPVLLPRLDPVNDVPWDGQSEVVLTVAGIAGLTMTVAPGSMTLPDGSQPSPGDPVVLSLNQVHHDDVPMPMPDGASPPFAWTLQPAGAHFDPPIQLTYPNMSGLPAGAVAYFLSFDHATNQFEIVASASVDPEGALIVSDAGSGLSVSGWGCNCPPYSVTGDCENCDEECLATGEITGGEVAVSPEGPCEPGDTIVWTVAGVEVSDGLGELTCEDEDGNVTVEQAVLSGGLQYKSVITKPDGTTVEAMGPSASIVVTDEGQYSCQFTAQVVRNCPPPDKVLEANTVTYVEVGFQADAGQNFGYDDDPTAADVDYVSLDKAGTTTVQVTTAPDGDGYVAVSSDTNVFTVPGGKVALSGATTTVTLTGANGAGDHQSAKLQVRAGDENGPVCRELNVEVYKKLDVNELHYYRVRDPGVAATTPAKNPTLADLKTAMNAKYKQGVVEVLTVSGSTDQQLAYDKNMNGLLDYYNGAGVAQPELDVITGAGLAGTNRIAYFEAIRDNWRLSEAAAMGSMTIKVESTSGLGTGNYNLGPPSGAPEVVNVTAIDAGTKTLTLAAALGSAHAATDTLYGGLAGLSTDPQLVTDAGGELIVTIVHEMLHRDVFGDLADVSETDNIMYWTTGGTGAGLLRFRDQTVVNTGTGVPTGAKEKQWNAIKR